MEKQHNRGQDGAGLASIKLDSPPGKPFMARVRNNKNSPWSTLFRETIEKETEALQAEFPDTFTDPKILAEHFRFSGQLLMGHLRYATHGENDIGYCHPVIRSNNWKSRSLMMAGNFNLTNVDYLFNYLVELGQHPRFVSDTETVLERVGHFLDEENERLFRIYKDRGIDNQQISGLIAKDLDVRRILQRAATKWDGGYVMGGLIGHGDGFIARDPNGIRPGYYYKNDEFLVAASERVAIATTFNVAYEDIQEIKPGHVLIAKADGEISEKAFTEAGEKTSCTFERIYFSRGNDPAIYRERLELGRLLVPSIVESLGGDLDNAVFSYIPNTAEMAFWGMIKGVETHMNQSKIEQIRALNGTATDADLDRVLNARPRVEKVILKDAKLRTFITDDSTRDDLVAHVYDITQGCIVPGKDTLVAIDDSIVRGTTLKKSIVRILARLKPKKIVIVSSAPQIRYPDCYGIDMSQLGRFVAFQAAIQLLKDRGMERIIQQVYRQCKAWSDHEMLESKNLVKEIYKPFTEEEVSRKIAEMLTPPDLECKLEIVYQPLSNLKKAIPGHSGDWYFSGDFPTPGGNRVVNQAFINYVEGSDKRAY